MQVLIWVASAAESGESADEMAGDLAELRSWLDETADGKPWEIAPLPPSDGGTLGLGVDEICAIVGAVEGLPVLISAIKGWRGSKQDPAPITLTITLDAKKDEVTVGFPDGTEVRHVNQSHA